MHFASHPNVNIVDMFNKKNQREFYSNADYDRVGGNKEEMDSDFCDEDIDEQQRMANMEAFPFADQSRNSYQNNHKIFSLKRKELLCTSILGDWQN